MTENTLKITYGQAEEHSEAARERLRRTEAGETGEAIEQDVRFILNFEDFEDVERLMRSSTLTVLEAIVSERPQSIRELARLLESDYKEVYRKLQELESLGVIEFVEEGVSKKPVLRKRAENIEFSFQLPHTDQASDSEVSV